MSQSATSTRQRLVRQQRLWTSPLAPMTLAETDRLVASICPLLDSKALPLCVARESIPYTSVDALEGADKQSNKALTAAHGQQHDKSVYQQPLERLAMNCQNQYEVQHELQKQAAVVHMYGACQPLHHNAAKAVYAYRRLRTLFIMTTTLTCGHRALRWSTRRGWLTRWFSPQQLYRANNTTRWLAIASMVVLGGWYWWQCRSVGGLGWWHAMYYRYVTTPPVTVHVTNSTLLDTNQSDDESEPTAVEHFLVHRRIIAQQKLQATGTALDLLPIV
ncbi:hypothetical protein BDF19DRAFT_441565 [Syncephalis fuscata]|nr:hypothetical protein BDF19DRAFT_441565 [Syncephalis fuscata]